MANANTSEYVLDKLVDTLEDRRDAREELEVLGDGELGDLVYSLYGDLLDLDQDENIVYTEARAVLYDRGYTYRSIDTELAIIDEETGEVL